MRLRLMLYIIQVGHVIPRSVEKVFYSFLTSALAIFPILFNTICNAMFYNFFFAMNINNKKTNVKKKTDKNLTGNKKIKLQEWEEEFLKILNYKKNPVFLKIPGACSIGTENGKENTSQISTEINMDTQLLPSLTSIVQKRRQKRIKQETEETKNLSTQELQRLVLLEQLNLARLQAKREQLMIG
ncbi:unnamed protein product [Psylliodes chrysocephalus]|uniref:Uncharacterized protein n=1 Tax=Psylliodes chrysocephalus TaxID=3402493 RepID=A0A9P0GC02_9CUCU|nr:unnamed protein product [Psylliodes chrysocephala]